MAEPESWEYCDPAKPPGEGWYFMRWAHRQDMTPRQVNSLGEVWIEERSDWTSWELAVKEWGRQYWPEPIPEPPDLWTAQEPPEIFRKWDADV